MTTKPKTRNAHFCKKKDAHDDVIQTVHRAMAEALEIEARAKIRLADEYDADRSGARSLGTGSGKIFQRKISPRPPCGIFRSSCAVRRDLTGAFAPPADPEELIGERMGDRGDIDPERVKFNVHDRKRLAAKKVKEEGKSIRQAARELNCDDRTVRRDLGAANAANCAVNAAQDEPLEETSASSVTLHHADCTAARALAEMSAEAA